MESDAASQSPIKTRDSASSRSAPPTGRHGDLPTAKVAPWLAGAGKQGRRDAAHAQRGEVRRHEESSRGSAAAELHREGRAVLRERAQDDCSHVLATMNLGFRHKPDPEFLPDVLEQRVLRGSVRRVATPACGHDSDTPLNPAR